jgi:hypothetical protein
MDLKSHLPGCLDSLGKLAVNSNTLAWHLGTDDAFMTAIHPMGRRLTYAETMPAIL